MKFSKRSLKVCILSTAMISCTLLASGFMLMNKAAVSAEESNIASETQFCVLNRAEIRVKHGESNLQTNGIRFTTVIDDAYYEAQTGGEWGMILGRNGVSITDLTVANAQDASNKDVVFYQPNGSTSVVPYETTNGDYAYQAVITFNNKEGEELCEAYATQMTARAYYKSTDNTVTYAYTYDAAYSISQVAEKVLLEDALLANPTYYGADENSDDGILAQKAILEGYVANNIYGKTLSAEAYITAKNDGSFEVTGVDASLNNKSLFFNGKSIGVKTVSNGKFTLTEDEVGTPTLGDIYSLAYFHEDGYVQLQSVQYVTEVISTSERLTEVIAKTYYYLNESSIFEYNATFSKGSDYSTSGTKVDLSSIERPYYVLNANLTFTKPVANYINDANCKPIFHGTLDGKGHTITFATADNEGRVLRGGMFGYLNKGATIKNVELYYGNGSLNTFQNTDGALAYDFLGDNIIENVVITVKTFAFNNTTADNHRNILVGTLNNVKMKDVLVSVNAIAGTSSRPSQDMIALGGGYNNNAKFENVNIILPSDFTTETSGKNVVAKDASTSTVEYYANNTNITESDTQKKLTGVNVYAYTDKSNVANTIGTWTINPNKIGQEDLAENGYKPTKLTFDRDLFATEFDNIKLFEDAYIQADGTLVGFTAESITIDGESYGVSEGKITGFDGSLGEYYDIRIGGTTVSVQYVTEVIMTSERLNEITEKSYYYQSGNVYKYNASFTKFNDTTTDKDYKDSGEKITLSAEIPYYVLGKDMEFTKSVTNYGTDFSSSPIFHGILDGKGHTLTLKNANVNAPNTTFQRGLFGQLSNGSGIKNVEFVVGGLQDLSAGGVIGEELLGNNLLENVVITIRQYIYQGNSRYNGLVAKTLNDVTMNNVLINVNEIVVNSQMASEWQMIGLGGGLKDSASFSNVHIVYPKGHATNSNGVEMVASTGTATSGTHYIGVNSTGNGEKLAGVNVYYRGETGNVSNLPTVVGSWNVDLGDDNSNIGTAVFAEKTLAKDMFACEDQTVSVNETFTINELISWQGVFKGNLRFAIVDTTVVCFENGVFTALKAGTTEVKLSYQIGGTVYVKSFMVTVSE